MPDAGGFGTRIYFIPNSGMDLKASQILKGGGYTTINLKGAHYSSEGNLWQRFIGGSDKVTLSTQITHVSAHPTSSASIEETRQIDVGHPYYFGSNRAIALNLPTDCDAIEMSVAISAIKNDNLSGALDILNSDELKGTLQLAPPAVSSALAIANVVKKLLTNTDPQSSLQGEFVGRLSVSASDNPIRDYCLAQGTIILIYRESEDDTSLDDLDPAHLAADGDGLKYDGRVVANTYVMFQVSFTSLRGEDPSSQWFQSFSAAEQSLDSLVTAASDSDKQKIWASAFATYQEGIRLLLSDPTYIGAEAKAIAATHLAVLRQKYADLSGQPKPAVTRSMLFRERTLHETLLSDDLDKIALDYKSRLARSNVALVGPL